MGCSRPADAAHSQKHNMQPCLLPCCCCCPAARLQARLPCRPHSAAPVLPTLHLLTCAASDLPQLHCLCHCFAPPASLYNAQPHSVLKPRLCPCTLPRPCPRSVREYAAMVDSDVTSVTLCLRDSAQVGDGTWQGRRWRV
jgi:hypothetical protein